MDADGGCGRVEGVGGGEVGCYVEGGWAPLRVVVGGSGGSLEEAEAEEGVDEEDEGEEEGEDEGDVEA